MRADESLQTRWYLVRTKPKQEDRADCNLRARGVETLAPRIKETASIRHNRTAPSRGIPLFPSYIFARFNLSKLSDIRLVRGVQSVVGFGECATPVDDSVIEIVRNRIDGDGYLSLTRHAKGDVVEIADGPFRSFRGVFERYSGVDRVRILLTAIGRAPVAVHVTVGLIRKSAAQTSV